MAGTSVDEKWSSDKLDSSNWTFKCVTCYSQRDFGGHVDGTTELAENANTQAQTEFQRKSQRAFSTIVLAISTPQLYLVTSCEQPKDA